MRRGIAAVLVGSLVLAVLVAALWSWCWRVVPSPMATKDDPRTPPPRSDLAQAPFDAAGAGGTADPRRAPAVDAVAAAAGTEADESDDIAIDVLVLDGLTGAPRPGAKVWFWTEAAHQEMWALPEDDPRRRGHVSTLLPKFGRSAACDSTGRVRITASMWTQVLAESAGWMGSAHVDEELAARGGLLRIALLPERRFDVRVVTRERQPVAGALVEVVRVGADGRPLRSAKLRGSQTARDGIAPFHHLQHPSDEEPPLVGDEPIAVVLLWPGCADVVATLLPSRLPNEPIELMLPPCGSIVVGIRDRNATHDGATLAEPGDPNGAHCDLRLPSDSGTFAHVPIGHRYELRRWAFPDRLECDGPRAAGEVVRIELVASPDCVELVGTLGDVEGAALGDRGVTLSMIVERPYGSVDQVAVSLRTQADGSWRARAPALKAGDRLCSGLATIDDSGLGEPAAPLPSMDLVPGRNDLGRLSLARSVVVVAGRLLMADDDGTKRVLPVVEQAETNGSGWSKVPGLVARRRDNAFEVLGAVDPRLRLRLHFGGDLLLAAGPAEFAAGATGLELVAVPCVDTLATAQFDAAVPPDLVAELTPLDLSPGLVRSMGSTRHDPRRGGFEIQGQRAVFRWSLPAGTYRLSFGVLGFPTPLATVPEVVVAAGRTDPRAEDVDLRGKLAWLELRVRDPDGNPLAAKVVARGVTAIARADQKQIEAGQRVLVPAGPLDLVVYHDSYPPVELSGAQGVVQVTVKPWRRCEIVLRGLPPLPDGCEWWLGAGPGHGRLPDWSQLATHRECWGDSQRFVGDRVRLAIGEGPLRAELKVWRAADRELVNIPGLEPAELRASDAPIVVRVPTAAASAVLLGLGAAPR